MSEFPEQKIEVIIYSSDGVMIQDITYVERIREASPILRFPTIKEMEKIIESCQKRMKSMRVENECD